MYSLTSTRDGGEWSVSRPGKKIFHLNFKMVSVQGTDFSTRMITAITCQELKRSLYIFVTSQASLTITKYN
jgi:hypothetical protein